MASNMMISHSRHGDEFVTEVSLPIKGWSKDEFVFSSQEPDEITATEWLVTIRGTCFNDYESLFNVKLCNQEVSLEKFNQKVEYGVVYPKGDRPNLEMKRLDSAGPLLEFEFTIRAERNVERELLLKVTTRRDSTEYEKMLSAATNLNIYHDTEFSDVVVKCGGINFECHKVVLAVASPVFKTMLTSNMQEEINNEIKIDDIKPEVMTELLEFIYTGRSSNLDQFSTDLLIAADKYGIVSMKMLCEEILINSLGLENCFSLLIMSDTSSPNIKKSALKFVIENKESIKFDELELELAEHPSLVRDILMEVFG